MATLKYKTPEGEWKKVSIGGGGSTEEVYVGSDAPTDENVKVWIDPTGTPSQPSQPSADNVYIFSSDFINTIIQGDIFTFTPEEVTRFLAAYENRRKVRFLCEFSNETYEGVCIVTSIAHKLDEPAYIVQFDDTIMANEFFGSKEFYIQDDGDSLLAYI